MSVPLFLKYWHTLESNKAESLPLFDPSNTFFDVWQDESSTVCYGMRQRETEELHGIVRKSSPIGYISEATYKNGVRHGLSREVWAFKIELFIYREGDLVAYLQYDRNQQEIHRSGKQVELFKDMHVIDFLPPEITHEPEWETEECDASAKELETEQSPQYVQHQQLITTEGAGDVGDEASETYVDQINLDVKTSR